MAKHRMHPGHCSVRYMFEAMMAGFDSDSSSPDLSPIRNRFGSPEYYRKGEIEIEPCERFNGRREHYSQIAEKNAQQLIKQEEQAKLKAERKKAKKKRQQQKKKALLEDSFETKNYVEDDNSKSNILKNTEDLVIHSDKKESEAELDINAAFVTKAVKKVNLRKIITEETNSKTDDESSINSIIKTALELENKQHYKEAAQHLCQAIHLAPKRCDLILKRSFIYYQLAKFEISIRDALKVLQFSPNNIDAYYRLAEGHFALNNLSHAEEAYTKLLNFKAYTEECNKRIFSIRVKQLEEMGYHPNEAFTALMKSTNKTLDEAIEFLTNLEQGNVDTEDLYYSDEEVSEEEEDTEEEEDVKETNGPSVNLSAKEVVTLDKRSPLLTDPSNPLTCPSLFVGNLKKDITEQEMEDVFIKFGPIKSIKLVLEPTCYGFVNYEESSSAGQAMQALQGSRWLLSIIPLTLRYPLNVANKLATPALMTKLRALSLVKSTHNSSPNKPSPVAARPVKPHPPPKVEDCFFWTTSGCSFGDKCFNLHRPECKGSALKKRLK